MNRQVTDFGVGEGEIMTKHIRTQILTIKGDFYK